MTYLRSKLPPLVRHWPWVKYAPIMLGASVWLYALVDQLDVSAGVMKYLLMSLIMLAIALV
jgi:hypothetical protein